VDGSLYVTPINAWYTAGKSNSTTDHAVSVIRSFVLPSWLGGKMAVFTSSGSQSSELHERTPHLRAPMHRRLKFIIWDCSAWLHVAFILFVLVAVGLSTYWVFTDYYPTRKLRLIGLLTHAGWPPVIWLTCMVSCWVPISYAVTPPDMPDREALMDRDPKTGVAYPTKWAKATKTSWITWSHEVQYSIVSVSITGVFIASFWI